MANITRATSTASAAAAIQTARAYAAASPTAVLAPATIRRRALRAQDVRIEILFCGVCHSDLHQVRDEWHATNPTTYPCVPGHEIVGRVVETGSAVRRFKDGDVAAVGCLVDSCRTCAACRDGEEQFCDGPATFTYNSDDSILGGVTFGGYSESIVVDEAFVLRVPSGLHLAGAAPLLCAGITTYSPLRHWNVRDGQTVGIVGLGGLGHMGVKLAAAFGARVVVFTTSRGKVADAVRLGAHEVVISTDAAAMASHLGRFDFLLDTVSAQHEIAPYLDLLKRNGTMTTVGAPGAPLPVQVMSLIGGRRRFAGSLIGGIRETQEMLDFCGARGITADVEVIPIQKINEAYDRMIRGDVKYRFVIDMASLKRA